MFQGDVPLAMGVVRASKGGVEHHGEVYRDPRPI